MSIFKHPASGVYFADVTDVNGKRARRSLGTKIKSQAQEAYEALKAELWRQKQLGQRPTVTFDQAALDYLKFNEHLRDIEGKRLHIQHWRSHFGSTDIGSLTTDMIEAAVPQSNAKRFEWGKPISGATKNRYLATLGAILNNARKRGWVDSVPYIKKYAESKGREEYLSVEQAHDLLAALGEGWMFDVTAFAMNTGMRASEILTLEWDAVNMDRRMVAVHASKAKSGHGRAVPLNEGAFNVIQRRAGLSKRWVFSRGRTPAREIDRRIWRNAVKQAGLPAELTFHSATRHTWASWHAANGTSLLMLQQLGGWRTLTMVNRYAHLAGEHLSAQAANGQILPQAGKPSEHKKSHLRVVNG